MNLFRAIILSITYCIVVAYCHPAFAQQDSNPLLGMIGKGYGEYFDEYEALCDSLFSGDSLAREELVRLFSEAATADPTGEWELDGRRMAANVRFCESRKGGFVPSEDYTTERFAKELLGIARTAKEKGFEYLWLRSLFNAADAYRIFGHDYELAFRHYLQLAAGLENVSQREFPWKLFMYREIADFYFSFREYKDATVFYRKIAEDPDATYKNNHRLYPALNGLGLCYRYAGEYEKSDSCFLRILELSVPIEEDRYVWEGIAGGNIGINYSLRGDTDKALAWMKRALAKMKRPNDDAYTSNLAANIADVYFEKNDIPEGEKYLNIALDYHKRTRIPEKNSRLLEVMARCHALRGDRKEAAACLDSTIRAKEREHEAYSGLVLRRVEQQLRAADQRVHEQELYTEKLRSTFYRQTALWVACTLAVILILLVLLGVYYRRTRQAYHELVLRSQQWAKVGVAEERTHEAKTEADDGSFADDRTAASERTRTGERTDTDDGTCTDERTAAGVRTRAGDATVDDDATAGDNYIAGDNYSAADDPAVDGDTLPDSTDRTIMEKIEQLMNKKKLYTNAELSLDMLATELGMRRRYVSGAINVCTSKNFFTYVNEYRVKEAIRLMSDAGNEDRTIDAIGFDSGFNDRKTFHRIFKQFTGLTPGAFRDSL